MAKRKQVEEEARARHRAMIANMTRSHGNLPDAPPWQLNTGRQTDKTTSTRVTPPDEGARRRRMLLEVELAKQRHVAMESNIAKSHGGIDPPWEVNRQSSEFGLEGELRGYNQSRLTGRAAAGVGLLDGLKLEPQGPQGGPGQGGWGGSVRGYKVQGPRHHQLKPSGGESEADQVLRAFRGGTDRLDPAIARRDGGRHAGGSTAGLTEAARLRALRALRGKEVDLLRAIGNSTFRAQLSQDYRPSIRDRQTSLEMELREVETAISYYEHTRAPDLPGAESKPRQRSSLPGIG